MFIGTCNCDPRTLSMSRRGLLCAGGAGFVTALIGTLASSSRTARAQVLASNPPEVDSVAVRIVTDNQIIKWIPTEKRDGLTIERRPGGNLSPDAPPSVDLVAEWGLSMHAESRRGNEVRNILVDFGYQPQTLLNNMSVLKIDPARFDALVLSHGHSIISADWSASSQRTRAGSRRTCLSSSAERIVSARARPLPVSTALSTARRSWRRTCRS